MSSTRLSVVIPTYQRKEETFACIRTLLKQERLPDEILLVDDSPSDAIRELVKELAPEVPDGVDLRYEHNPGRPSLTRARNHGIDHTRGDIVVFFDSDALVPPDFLRIAVADLEAMPQAKAIRGLVDDPPFSPLYNAYRRIFRQSVVGGRSIRIGFPPTFTKYPVKLDGIVPSESMRGCNMVIRREVFDEVRFDPQMERYSFFEDIDFALSLRRRWPGGLYADGNLVMSHPKADGGRIRDADLFFMEFLHRHYLAHKHFRVGPWRRLLLWYTDVGSLVMKSRRNPVSFLRLRRAYREVKRRLREHGDSLRAGDLAPLNAYFSFMQNSRGAQGSPRDGPLPPGALDDVDMQRPGTH